MKKTILSLALLAGTLAFAQTGINTTNPQTTLDIRPKKTDGSTVEGVMTPQVTGDALKTMVSSMGAAHNGNLVYVTAAVTTPNTDAATANVTYPGYYRFNYDAATSTKSFVRIEPSGLEKVISTDTTLGLPASTNYGWKMIGEDTSHHLPLGSRAIDMTTWLPGVWGYTEPFGAAGIESVALGGQATALGLGAVAVGSTSISASQNSLAMMGGNVSQGATEGIAIGHAAFSNRVNSVALGEGTANGVSSFAVIGGTTSGNYSFAVGKSVSTNADYAVAIGADAEATGSLASGLGSLAMMGGVTGSTAASAIAIGTYATANGQTSTAIGYESHANGDQAIAMGGGATADGLVSLAMMGGKTATGADNSVAIGTDGSTASSAAGKTSLAMMGGTTAAGADNSVAIGTSLITPSSAAGRASLAMMGGTTATGAGNSVAIGNGTTATATIPFAVGTNGNQLTITPDGKVGIGLDSAAATEKLEVNGRMKLTPQSSKGTCDDNSKGVIVFDSTDNNFYGCRGTTGGWVNMSLSNVMGN